MPACPSLCVIMSVGCSVTCVAGQELRITPDYKLASEDSATLFKCEAFQNQQQDADLKWFHIRRDGSEVQITDINGR